MKRFIAASTVLVATLACASLAQRQPGEQSGAAADPNQNQTTGANQSQQFTQEDQKDYIQAMASCNQFEIQAGQLADQRAQDQQVKQLAQHIVQDHQKAQQQLQQIAQQANVQIDQQLMPVHQAKLQALEKKQGAAFDRKFTFMQVAGHTEALLENQWVAAHAQDPQVKQYAQQQVPVLEQHLRLAERTADQFVPEARQAGERLHGRHGQGSPGDIDQTGTGRDQGTSGGQSGTSGGQTGTSGQGTTGGQTGTSGQGTSGGQSGADQGSSAPRGTNR